VLLIDHCSCDKVEEYDGTVRNASATTIMTLRDMLKFGLFYLQKGSWEGKQLLDPDIVEEARTKRVETRDFILAHLGGGFCLDTTAYGYGYQMWMNKYGGFTLWGGNAQVLCCIPEKDLMLSFACFDEKEASTSELSVTDIMYDTIVKGMKDEPLPEDRKAYEKMLSDLENWSTAPKLGSTSPKAKAVSGVEYTLKENELGIKSMKLGADACSISFIMGSGEERIINYGTDGKFVLNSKGLGHRTDDYSTVLHEDPDEVSASGGWDGEDFVLDLHYTAHMNSFISRFSFGKYIQNAKGL